MNFAVLALCSARYAELVTPEQSVVSTVLNSVPISENSCKFYAFDNFNWTYSLRIWGDTFPCWGYEVNVPEKDLSLIFERLHLDRDGWTVNRRRDPLVGEIVEAIHLSNGQIDWKFGSRDLWDHGKQIKGKSDLWVENPAVVFQRFQISESERRFALDYIQSFFTFEL